MNALTAGFNELARTAAGTGFVTSSLRTQIRTPSRWSIEDKYGVLLCIVIPTFYLTTPLLAISLVIYDKDCTYFIFEYILPHPMSRTSTQAMGTLAIRRFENHEGSAIDK
ncbi:unnamed protein product [Orchesella dallaii]|uniref:Uncharacterized protein n=1 Tax=Orchesella dallaii TaxID=48710 RepID=A0ABP1PML6_9HEXA